MGLNQDEEAENEYGKHFKIRDIERVGFFDDPPAGPFEKWLGPPLTNVSRCNPAKGPQMACSKRSGLFETEFKRIFCGEALPELGLGPKKKKKQKEPEKLGVIVPAGSTKWHSTPGDAYGCFSGHPKAFSRETRPAEERKKEPPNLMTRPGAVGGPGYVDICIGPYIPMYRGYEPYEPEIKRTPLQEQKRQRREFVQFCRPREYFTENPYKQVRMPRRAQEAGLRKKMEGSRRRTGKQQRFHLVFPAAPLGRFNGCFDPFPRYIAGPPRLERKKRDKREPLRAPGGPDIRSKYTVSVVELVTRIACNPLNFPVYTNQVYTLK